MAQAQVNQQGFFKWVEFPLDAEHHLRICRKKGEPYIGIFKKVGNRRKGVWLTPHQFQMVQDMTESINLALSLVAPTN